jgi:hypothetical protein
LFAVLNGRVARSRLGLDRDTGRIRLPGPFCLALKFLSAHPYASGPLASFVRTLGEGALSGLTAPGGLQVERVGSLETTDATRTRVKWYVSLALFNTLKLAKLFGVRP